MTLHMILHLSADMPRSLNLHTGWSFVSILRTTHLHFAEELILVGRAAESKWKCATHIIGNLPE